jgi:hypothetical protein
MPMMTSEMNTMELRPLRPSRFRRASKHRPSVETLMDQIAELAAERQRLRDTGAVPAKLERNRIKLARSQWELSHALIERYLPVARHVRAA